MFLTFFKGRLLSNFGIGAKKIYFHIGISKTGTTTIQKYLNENTDFLESIGVRYICSGRSRGTESHQRLARIYKQGLDSAGVIQEIRQEIANSKCHSFIISSEMFEGLSDEGISRIKRDFCGFNLVLVVYLRYQDQAISSMYNEMVKKHACNVSFSDYVLTTPRKDLLFYGKMLDRWARFLGKKNIRVRVFDPSSFYRGDLIQDFLMAIERPHNNINTGIFTRKNEAVSSVAVDILANINRAMSYSVDHVRHYGLACSLAGILDRLIRDKFPELDKGANSFFVSKEEYEKFMSRYSDDNAMVSKHYLNGEPFCSKGFFQRQNVASSERKDILIALSETLGLKGDLRSMSTDDLVGLIADYWSVELKRLCDEEVTLQARDF